MRASRCCCTTRSKCRGTDLSVVRHGANGHRTSFGKRRGSGLVVPSNRLRYHKNLLATFANKACATPSQTVVVVSSSRNTNYSTVRHHVAVHVECGTEQDADSPGDLVATRGTYIFTPSRIVHPMADPEGRHRPDHKRVIAEICSLPIKRFQGIGTSTTVNYTTLIKNE